MAQSDLRNLQSRIVAGAVAGNVACAGIKKGDKILAVNEMDFTLTEGVPNTKVWNLANRTAEFAATADDVINNVGGTSTLNKALLVLWVAKNPRG